MNGLWAFGSCHPNYLVFFSLVFFFIPHLLQVLSQTFDPQDTYPYSEDADAENAHLSTVSERGSQMLSLRAFIKIR
jgi:hypothetical protein